MCNCHSRVYGERADGYREAVRMLRSLLLSEKKKHAVPIAIRAGVSSQGAVGQCL